MHANSEVQAEKMPELAIRSTGHQMLYELDIAGTRCLLLYLLDVANLTNAQLAVLGCWPELVWQQSRQGRSPEKGREFEAGGVPSNEEAKAMISELGQSRSNRMHLNRNQKSPLNHSKSSREATDGVSTSRKVMQFLHINEEL